MQCILTRGGCDTRDVVIAMAEPGKSIKDQEKKETLNLENDN